MSKYWQRCEQMITNLKRKRKLNCRQKRCKFLNPPRKVPMRSLAPWVWCKPCSTMCTRLSRKDASMTFVYMEWIEVHSAQALYGLKTPGEVLWYLSYFKFCAFLCTRFHFERKWPPHLQTPRVHAVVCIKPWVYESKNTNANEGMYEEFDCLAAPQVQYYEWMALCQ